MALGAAVARITITIAVRIELREIETFIWTCSGTYTRMPTKIVGQFSNLASSCG